MVNMTFMMNFHKSSCWYSLSGFLSECMNNKSNQIDSKKLVIRSSVISTKIVHDFMNSLKSSSEQFSWYLHSPLRQTLADITDFIFDDDDIAAGVSQNTEYTPQRDGSNSTSAICLIAEGS